MPEGISSRWGWCRGAGVTFTKRVRLRGGVETTVETVGSAGPPEILALHGLGGDRAQALGLPTAERGRMALDFRAHGDATPTGPAALLSFQAFSDDVADVLDDLGVEDRLVVVGISMGAAVALRFALDHPRRVRALVLVRPAWLHEPNPPHLQAFPQIARLLVTLPPEAAREAFRETPTYRRVAAESEPTAASLLEQFDRPVAAARAAVLERMPASTPVRRLEELSWMTAAALVVACGRDPVHPVWIAQRLHRSLPHSAYTQVPSKAESVEAYRQGVANAIEAALEGA